MDGGDNFGGDEYADDGSYECDWCRNLVDVPSPAGGYNSADWPAMVSVPVPGELGDDVGESHDVCRACVLMVLAQQAKNTRDAPDDDGDNCELCGGVGFPLRTLDFDLDDIGPGEHHVAICQACVQLLQIQPK